MLTTAAIFTLAITVLLGILLNNNQTNRLGDRIDRLDAKIDRNLDASHRDALELMRQMTALHERVAVSGK